MIDPKVNRINPPNYGWLEYKLSDVEFSYVLDCISNKRKSYKKNLAGNITSSSLLEDKDGWFYENTIFPLICKYHEMYGEVVNAPVNNRHPYTMVSWWVNYQYEHEFNPLHIHNGVFSFVIWVKMPKNLREDNKDPISAQSNTPRRGIFDFAYTDMLGRIRVFSYMPDQSKEGLMLLFPAQLNHIVYPYTTKDERISVSGNIVYNTDLKYIDEPSKE